MVRFILVFALFGCALAGVAQQCPKSKNCRIVGGNSTDIKNHPFQVSLQYNGAHFCGGSLYMSNIIITAAHCLDKLKPNKITVRLGSSKCSSGGIVKSVSDFKIHPQYNEGTNENDVAVIKLSSNVTPTSTIKMIALTKSTPASGTPAVVTGWGDTKEGSFGNPDLLQAVTVKTLSNTQCSSSSYGYGSKIKPSMLCARSSGKDSCQGDSGGPLVAGQKLIGVVSWGIGCARDQYPGVYADVANLRSWIEKAY